MLQETLHPHEPPTHQITPIENLASTISSPPPQLEGWRRAGTVGRSHHHTVLHSWPHIKCAFVLNCFINEGLRYWWLSKSTGLNFTTGTDHILCSI